MRCPSCGYSIDRRSSDQCPQCGRLFGKPTEQRAPSPQMSPQHEPYPRQPLQPAPVEGLPGRASGQPPTDYDLSLQSPTVPYGRHGQYSPPTPPKYPVVSGYPPSQYARPPLISSLPEHKPHTGRIVGIVALVVVVLATCTGGALIVMRSLGQATATRTPSTATATRISTPVGTATATVIYGNTFSSDASGWPQDPGKCFLGSGGYHSVNGYLCYAPAGVQTDADISVSVQQISGHTTTAYGIVLRRVGIGNYYRFMIDSNSKWLFDKCVNDICTALIAFTHNAAIKGGLNTSNTLEVSAKGSHFNFFVNGTKVGGAIDKTFASGAVGVVSGEAIECVFTDFIVSRS